MAFLLKHSRDGEFRELFTEHRNGPFLSNGLGGTNERRKRCGDGKVDAGEQCDPPNGSTCSHACTQIVCGDGKVEGKEECDPPGTEECDSQCRKKPVCGNGLRERGEQCDPPGASSQACAIISPPAGQRPTGRCLDGCKCEFASEEKSSAAQHSMPIGGI